MHPRVIHGRKLALMILLASNDDVEESCCVVGRAEWDGRHVQVHAEDGGRFLVPAAKLDQIRVVPASVSHEIDGAELYLVIDDLSRSDELELDLRPAC
jgi:hypothetical protein